MALVAPELRKLFHELVDGKKPWPLFLYGDTGRGKTRAALALCDLTESMYFVPSQLMAAKPTDPVWRWAEERALVILDEMGATRAGTKGWEAFHYDTVKRLLDLRDERPGRVGVYISNLSPAGLQKVYDDRICSRVLCGTTFQLEGKDQRFAQ